MSVSIFRRALMTAAAVLVVALPAGTALAKKKKPVQKAPPAPAAPAVPKGEFIYDEKTNAELAKKLNIPVYFALPGRARAPLPQKFDIPEKLVDFKHPDAQGASGDIGLRLIMAKRAGLNQRLAKSGLVKTGDLLLTFRSEWGGAGPYPNIQMGVSHAGLAYIKNGAMFHLENPLSEEYMGAGMRGDLTSEHYRTLKFVHIIRPRELSDGDRANIEAWAGKVHANARKIYPKQLSFNSDYNAPKYGPGKPQTFVKQLGQMALGQNAGTIDMFCSEFAWSMLALRGCDPAKSADQFNGSGVPSCIAPVLKPMEATGSYMTDGGRRSTAGLADGPLMVIDSMNLPRVTREPLLRSVFQESAGGLAKMSSGHRTVAEQMKSSFAPLEQYYMGVTGGGFFAKIKARTISKAFRLAVPENYSPTAFLVNTILPPDNSNRTMDYVATIVFE